MNNYLLNVVNLIISINVISCTPSGANKSISSTFLSDNKSNDMENTLSPDFVKTLEGLTEETINEDEILKKISLNDIQQLFLFSIKYDTKILKQTNDKSFNFSDLEKKVFHLDDEDLKNFRKNWTKVLDSFFSSSLSSEKKEEYINNSKVFFNSNNFADNLETYFNAFFEVFLSNISYKTSKDSIISYKISNEIKAEFIKGLMRPHSEQLEFKNFHEFYDYGLLSEGLLEEYNKFKGSH